MWMRYHEKNHLLWNKIKLLFLAFPSSYLVEQGFSTVTEVVTKNCGRSDVCNRGDLKLKFSNVELDNTKLVRRHQTQGSHWKS